MTQLPPEAAQETEGHSGRSFMSIHPELYQLPEDLPDVPLLGYASAGKRGQQNEWHHHPAGQLYHVIRGSAALETQTGTFFVPPERAVWIPAGISHRGRYLAETDIRFLYVAENAAPGLPRSTVVVQVTRLLRELILEFMTFSRAEVLEGPAARIAAVILDQLRVLPEAPLQLPMPRDGKLRALCEHILVCPAEVPGLIEAADRCATSVRSFERRIVQETGLSYRSWCRQAKLFRALELLATGMSVSDVSHRLGYEGPSAFVSVFRKAFGVTPGRYFDNPSAV
ncbi:transcriptional regulator, AraC family [Roseibium suaedae]|uniref:Transcriptional regulator, AraC family n=2 Tax=Roseibium suaedae TaxID=735517 RepID=A0A1M7GK68_9HYPH|nr:transcriptional regulator, AraC family [Roseibium suaedae]